jgi:Protein of unknown function (DUF1565)
VKFLSLVVLFVCVSGALGQSNSSFYVSMTGADSNPGTQTEPWRTVQHAADTVRAGSTVNVRGGVYEELVSIKASGNATDGFITFRVLHENLEKRVIYAGLTVLSDLTAAVAVAVGMWEPASFAGFQAPRAGRTVGADLPSFRPRSAISTARPRFIGHSGENLLFGRPAERR